MARDKLAADELNPFEITQFLEGRTVAWGIVEDRFGKLRRRFNVAMNGYWEGASFVLDECFTYDTGEAETRRWLVMPRENGKFSATCEDCVGSAEGECVGDAILMLYRFRLTMGGHRIVVNFSDRLYRIADDMAVNRATISKWGVRLVELFIFFKRESSRSLGGAVSDAA
jgi:hypothetical protein